jgi:hypothetical protein
MDMNQHHSQSKEVATLKCETMSNEVLNDKEKLGIVEQRVLRLEKKLR